jgi:cell division protein FtsB
MRTRRFLWLAAGAAVWGLAYSIFGATGLVGVYRTEAEVERLEAEVAAAQQVNAALRAEAEALESDPMAIEGAARELLGLVKEGDKVYLLPTLPAQDATRPADPSLPSDGADTGPVSRP